MTLAISKPNPGGLYQVPVEEPRWGWINGRFVPWNECVLHVRSQAVMTGASVFEGLRAYWNSAHEELHIFRLEDHMERLRASMKVMRMSTTFGDQLGQACIELLARNEFREDVHIMPFAYVGIGAGFGALTKPLDEGFFITAVARPQPQTLVDGIHVRTSSWRRISDATMPPRVKAAANYQNSRLAMIEARADGYDNAIFLNQDGTVAEATGSCLMMLRNGRLCTPPVTAGILESITRATLMELSATLVVQVVERPVDRTELYLADEVFLCGSGQEVTPVVSLDRLQIGDGKRGAFTRQLQDRYFKVARGEDTFRDGWCTPVYRRSDASIR